MEAVSQNAIAGPSRIGTNHSQTLPLSFDLRARTVQLLSVLGYDVRPSTFPSDIPIVLWDVAFPDPSRPAHSARELLDALSLLASCEGISSHVLLLFSEVVLDLLARWHENSEGVELNQWERRLAVLAMLPEIRPELWSLVTAFIAISPFRSSPLSAIAEEDLASTPSHRLHLYLLAYLRLITADPLIAKRNDWPSAPLHLLRTQHPDRGVRLLAIQILAVQREWSEVERLEMEKEWVGEVDEVTVEVSYGDEVVKLSTNGYEVRKVMVSGWIIPVLEARRATDHSRKRADILAADIIPNPSPAFSLDASQLSTRTALIADVLLIRAPIPSGAVLPDLIHVPTSASTSALQQISPNLQLGVPILLASPTSSGKTHILHYLSSQLYPSQQPTNPILTIPLADTTIDVKSLIGTYISSQTKPGTFEWMEGALAKAVRAGRWVVFDDIDRASLEMLVTVAGLTRSLTRGRAGRRATLAVPGRDTIEAGEGFAIFATRTTRQEATATSSFFGNHNFTEITLNGPTDDDILAILSAKFKQLPSSVITISIDVWSELRPVAKVGGHVKGRDIGLRDLEKWCARVQRNLPPLASLAALERAEGSAFANPVFQDEVLLEAADMFLAALDNKPQSIEVKVRAMRIITEKVGMDNERAIALLNIRKPQLETSPRSRQLRIGRTSLPVASSDPRDFPSSQRPFAVTRPSLVLLERIAVAGNMGEPVLLVGETGTGKTTAVQFIANACRKPLSVLNLSTQTESSDLLGGYKPLDAAISAPALHARWQKLFCDTFSMAKPQNGVYLEAVSRALNGRRWDRCADLWAQSARRAVEKLSKQDADTETQSGSPRKKRKIINSKVLKAVLRWQSLLVDIAEFDVHHVKMRSRLVFSFVEGPLVKALKSGEWLLLDEVNLASQETLEAISTLLEGSAASLVLTERGDTEPIQRHPDFRLFACMNPATDVGKKDLPPNLRSRFTEIYVPPPDDDREALIHIVGQYLGDAAAGDKGAILDVVEMYSTLKRLSSAKEIVDASNAAPNYSMRTLARALTFAVELAPMFGLRRGLWEGCLMAFTMSLDATSAQRAHGVCEQYLLAPMKNAGAVLAQIPSLPSSVDRDDFIRFGPFWLRRGPLPPSPESRYIITASVQAKLADLARVILTHRYPVLIQGPTSSGKTSAVEFLARQTGHRFVRINNHEHTDIQEYLGSYVTDPQTGNLVFQEGLLVTAVRRGHWIVLDELNLAPTDVLEALNRLLDDNHELVIPETQEVITPHPNFILFATQNPPGLYAGRKVLSRAFRNRFLEVHFNDVPKDELENILYQRCQIAPSYARRIVQVFEELRHRRQASRVFESKQSFATLRDLFRWAERGAVGYQQLAEDGYMLLAEKARQQDDRVVIKQVIEEVMRVVIDEGVMYRLFEPASSGLLSRLPFETMPVSKLVWTRAMQRLFGLVAFALAHNEPVLLVGETGCGKTSVCDVIAQAFSQQVIGVNCHQNMETADLLGSQRPVRNRKERRAKMLAYLSTVSRVSSTASDDDLMAICDDLLREGVVDHGPLHACQLEIKQLSALFEWSDGPLVDAMKKGDLLLLDEVALADDSVLERLNSVLEPGRTLVLAEKGGWDIDDATLIAKPGFHVVATMNPGGDFGKKELSPALRNRFTEIWVPPLTDRRDLLQILEQSWRDEQLKPCGPLILDFFDWFGSRIGDRSATGLRDILAWLDFCDYVYNRQILDASHAFHHGGEMVVVDGLESLPQIASLSAQSFSSLRSDSLKQLSALASTLSTTGPVAMPADLVVKISQDEVEVGGFAIPRGSLMPGSSCFRFEAPTTALNAMRVLRACQLPKAILLEGSPGVGKTSLVSALAALAGHHLQRINLSDQTDLIDLFGTDLPVEGGQAGEFQWHDAALLDAMQNGDWVLLDEMNLASQTVLEGLNAVLDHRGKVFIPELGRSFDRHPAFRILAAQNPLQQGGGRKGLPRSFLNRFTKVYLQEQTREDLVLICRDLHPVPLNMVENMIAFNEAIRDVTMVTRIVGQEGSPWEFNLRDLFRWFQLLSSPNGLETTSDPVEHLQLVYEQRFRNERDRSAVRQIFGSIFGMDSDGIRPTPFLTPEWFQIGHSLVPRSGSSTVRHNINHEHLDIAESVLKCVEMNWVVSLAGESGAGKRSLIRSVAEGAGRTMGEFAMHPGVDTSDILGSFEQRDIGRLVQSFYEEISRLIEAACDHEPSMAALSKSLRDAYDSVRPGDAESLDNLLRTSKEITEQLPSVHDNSSAMTALELIRKAGPKSAGFAWVDGELLNAIRSGSWFLISEANLCSSSVLDRLNSLCESNGFLVLNEKGSATGAPEIIKPHPDFRLFMTYDPRHGELSRAMRNRGVELFLSHTPNRSTTPSPSLAKQSTLQSMLSLDSSWPDQRISEVLLPVVSHVANTVTLQSMQAMPYFRRFPTTVERKPADLYSHAIAFLSDESMRTAVLQQHGEVIRDQGLPTAFSAAMPLNLASNANLKTEVPDWIFRSLQLLLRNELRRRDIQHYVANSANAKTVLSVSAAATRLSASRRRLSASTHVYPFVSILREILHDRLISLIGPESSTQSQLPTLKAVEDIHVHLRIIEAHAMSDSFDYSSTQLLAGWLLPKLQQFTPLAAALEKLNGLAQAVEITTGLGQSEIWGLFLDSASASPTFPHELLQTLKSVEDRELLSSTLQAMIVGSTTSTQLSVYQQLSALLESLPSTDPARQQSIPGPGRSDWPILAILELRLMATSFKGDSDEDALICLVREPGIALSSLLDTISIAFAPTSGLGTRLRAISGWLSRLWDHDESDGQSLLGPAQLFASTQLASVLRFGSHTVRLHEVQQEESALRFSVESVTSDAKRDFNRKDASLDLVLESINMIVSSCGLHLDQHRDAGHLLAQLTALPSGHGPAEALRQGSTRYLFSPLSEVARVTNDLSALGGLWLGTSQFLLNLYVTNVPIDPAVRRILSGEMAVLRIALVEEELAAIEYGEVAMKGVSDSERAWRVLACLQALRDESASLGPAINRPGNPGRLAVLFNEIQGFQIEALADERLDQLVQALRLDDPRASLREDAFQKAAAAFVRRLSVNYQDLADLVSPIITAVLFARFGMRCLARAMRLRQSAVPFPDPEILGFPTVRAIDAVQRSACLPTDDVRQQLLVASACLYEISLSGEGMSNFTSLKSPLDGLYQTWSTVRSREQQEAQEAESLYRVRKTDMEVLSDDELEAQEFAELFPQYDDLGEAAESMRMPNGAIHEEPRRFTPRHIASFHRIIVEAFDSTSRDSGKGLFPETLNELLATSFDVAASGEDLDHTSLAFQVHQLHQRYASNQALPSHANFYTSPNKPEIRKAHSIVTGLICRIDVLIAEWPEQMVLQHIRDRCDRLLNLDSNSPVAMILAALELLLQHTSDWESYANRDNSLKSYQQKISELIIDWRRLELSSWTRLLDDQASQYIASDAEWTIRLYGALIHGATSVNDNSGHIEALIPMIAMYLKSSTLGHFASRLSVLACFRRLTRELSQSDTGANRNLAAVSTMLHNVLANAGLFSGRIRESLGTQRAVIDRSIKDFVKLASWKDVNVFALKASSQKSHRQLYRSIRKFREVLQQPVAPMLADLSSVCAQDAPQASDPRRACNLSTPFIRSEALQARSRHEDALPEHLARLGDTFDRYQQVFAHTLPEWPFPHGSQLDAMAVDIIETAAALRKATPATLTKDNTKVVKNLASRKRKAFADLLKALRASGFSQSLRADLLRRQQSIEWMAARPQLVLQNLPESFDTSGLSKIESYHHRQVVLMTAMRAASNFHNPDMASQDLQRGIGFAESLFATALGERDHLVSEVHMLSRLAILLQRLQHCSAAPSIVGGDNLSTYFLEAERSSRRIQDALREVEEGIWRFRELQNATPSSGDLAAVHAFGLQISSLVKALSSVTQTAQISGCSIFTFDEIDLLRQTTAFRARLVQGLSAQCMSTTEFRHLLIPVTAMIRAMAGFPILGSDTDVSPSVWTQSDDLIQALLVVAQRVQGRTSGTGDPESDDRLHIPTGFAQQRVRLHSLRIPEVTEKTYSLTDSIAVELSARGSCSTAPLCLARVVPFIEILADSLAQTVIADAFTVKSVYKLGYVFGRVMLDLAQDGFCKPSEGSDTNKGGQDGDATEGTGMGTGTGDKNVGSEIEEEGQIEGLQGEQEEEAEGETGEKEDEDDAMSMDEDFEGAMGEGKEKDEQDGSKEGSEDDEHDEHVRDVDPLDPGAVDEKFWGKEEETEDDQNGDEDLANEKTKDSGGQTDLSAKEIEAGISSKQKENEADEAENPVQDTQHNISDNENHADEIEDLDNEGEDHPAGQDQSEVVIPEGDKLDLPEDIDLEPDEHDEPAKDSDEDVRLSEGEDDERSDGSVGGNADKASQDDGEAFEDAPEASGNTEEDSIQPEETANQNLDISVSNDAQAEDVRKFGKRFAGSRDQPDSTPQQREQDEGEKNAEDGNNGLPPPGEGVDSRQSQGSPTGDGKDTDGLADSTGAATTSDADGQPQSSRSLGDILKDIRRRRDEIIAQQQRGETAQKATDASDVAPGQVEYLREEDTDEDMQALGPAGEEERQKLADLNILDDEMEGDMQNPSGMEDAEAQAASRPSQREPDSVIKPGLEQNRQTTEETPTQADVAGDLPDPAGTFPMGLDDEEKTIEAADEAKPDVDPEMNIRDAAPLPQAPSDGEELWRYYANLTSDLSYALCEQLRLILEPTLATRLQGDFRTGKRLNMRKIIPYIASEYTKDKIWLRRTKPSRREYQVLLSLDDSRSMAESHSVHLAYKTLALVSQALNKLEVGQVSVARFGESVDILHQFGETSFTDVDGAKVMSSFNFDQQRTDVAALVERTLSVLAEARQRQTSSSSAPDLWQLQIIISDGVCQDHHRLRTLLRRALEERVMIVFIIVDSLHQSATSTASVTEFGSTRPSILSMQTVEYKNVNGEMQLEMQRYLDTFPFEFFVVLRDVEALPGVLADTLRQWMARVSQSQE